MRYPACLAVLLAATLPASAGLFNYSSGPINATISDGNLAGWNTTIDVSGLPSTITDVSVSFSISGGYSGDFYAYLSYEDTLIPLLNRTGVGSENSFGNSASGMSVILRDGYQNIHGASSETSPLTGTYAPDGRAISPLSSPSSFDAAPTMSFGNLAGKNPNRQWTLFFADVVSGDQGQLVNWSLEITAVPEPANVALGIFGAVFSVSLLWRKFRHVGHLSR